MEEEKPADIKITGPLDYSDLTVPNDSVFGISNIPIERVEGVVDRFDLETAARKKDIEEVKCFVELSKDAILDSFDCNIELIKKEIKTLKTYVDVNYDAAVTRSVTTCRREFNDGINIIKKQLYIWIAVFSTFLLFLLFGFIYCIMSK